MDIKLFDVRKTYEAHPCMYNSIKGTVTRYFDELAADKLIEKCFYDGCVKNANDFIDICLDNRSIFMLIWDTDREEYVGHVYLAGFEGLLSRIHFGVLRKAHGRGYPVAMGKQVLDVIFSIKREDNITPLTSTLVGLTPSTNIMALRFVQALGFTPIIMLPNACFIEKKGVYVSGMLSFITR